MTAFSEAFKARQAELELNCEELSDFLGLSLGSIYNYRSGKQFPQVRLRLLIKEKMGLDPAEYVEDSTPLSTAISEAMTKAGYSPYDVASCLVTSPSVVFSWTRGIRVPTDEHRAKLECLLNFDLSDYDELRFPSLVTQAKLEAKVAEYGGTVHWSAYVQTNVQCKLSCNNPEHPDFWSMPFRVIFSNAWCKLCIQGKPRSAQTFYKEVAEHGGIPLGEYIRTDRRVLVDCGQGHKFMCSPNGLHMHGHWCKWCLALSKSKSGYLGVQRYRAFFDVWINRVKVSRHHTALDAAKARDKEIIKRDLHRAPRYHPLNFPEDNQ